MKMLAHGIRTEFSTTNYIQRSARFALAAVGILLLAVQSLRADPLLPGQPRITQMVKSTNGVILRGTNGIPGTPFQILSTTNLTLPRRQWSAGASNAFDALGNFVITNPISATDRVRFYCVLQGQQSSGNGIAPSITTQPVGLTVSAGLTATFNVVAAGTAPLTYQWTFKGVSISGATQSTYSRSNCASGDAGNYQVIVSNGNGSVTSSVATLTVVGKAYYVAPNGSDSANGSITAPWRTLEGATSKMSAGDTLYVRGGNYTEIFDIYGPNGLSSNAPTTIKAYPGETPVFTGPGNSNANSLNHLNWFVLDGLTITYYQQGLFVWAGCSNVVVRNLTVYNTGQEGIHIRDYSHHITVENCVIHDTGFGQSNGEGLYLGTSDFVGANDGTHDLLIRSNTVYNTLGEGIELKPGTHDITVDHNLIYSCNKSGVTTGAGGGAIEVDEEATYNRYNGNPNHIVRGNTVYDTPIAIRAGNGGQYYNNVIYGASQYGLLIDNKDSDSYTRYVYHNTIDMPSSTALRNAGGTTDVRNNMGSTATGNMATSSSYFVNAAAHNYHLVAGAAPINAGAILTSVVPTDIDGKVRVSPDMGAYEY